MEYVDLDLNSILDGELNAKFLQKYPDILKELKTGEKATVTIKIDIQREEDADIARMAGSLNVKMPAATKRCKICTFDGNDFTIKVEKPNDPGEQTVLKFETPKQA
jgi:hypothetical protein